MTRLSDRPAWAAGAAGIVSVAAAAVVTATALPHAAHAQCSVFYRHPCNPTFCGAFHRGPCFPEFDDSIGQDLRLTIVTPSADGTTPATRADADHPSGTEPHDATGQDAAHQDADGARKLDSIKDMFAALRACWVPPAESDAKPGMQMSVRFAFKRTGEIIGTPRVTYTTPNTPGDVRDIYHNAITAALERCTPMRFTRGMGGAVAGRPIAIRFVDNRKKP
jgi:hypothetical protein